MWQTNGLDLHIIPYGCISTGNMMGMIQVVQDSETVAKVMGKGCGIGCILILLCMCVCVRAHARVRVCVCVCRSS